MRRRASEQHRQIEPLALQVGALQDRYVEAVDPARERGGSPIMATAFPLGQPIKRAAWFGQFGFDARRHVRGAVAPRPR
jgi:hypothetical protein